MGIIYCAKNNINDMIYIGKTNKRLVDRVDSHNRSRGDGTKFHKAIAKYGISAFTFTEIDSADNEDELNILERVYIDMFSSGMRHNGYNTTLGGEGVPMTQEAIDKMRETKKGKISPMKGKKFSGQALINMRASRVGIWERNRHPMLGRNHTQDTRNKISESKTGKKIGNRVYNKDCVVCGERFVSRSSAGKYCANCGHSPRKEN